MTPFVPQPKVTRDLYVDRGPQFEVGRGWTGLVTKAIGMPSQHMEWYLAELKMNACDLLTQLYDNYMDGMDGQTNTSSSSGQINPSGSATVDFDAPRVLRNVLPADFADLVALEDLRGNHLAFFKSGE